MRAPRNIGPYRVVRPIARGGMGVVYEVQHPVTGEHLALKLLSGSGTVRQRFDREYEALIRLNHPGIVHVYHYGLHQSAPWFTMELVEGTPVQAYARDLGRPGTEARTAELVRVVRDLALALHHIHSRGLIHRDLKSANVLILPDGRVKLIDFGTAAVVHALESITRDGEFMGTFAYAAPEQLTPSASVDYRADLYALGVLMYRLFTGKLPFQSDNLRELARLQIRMPPRPPRDLVPALPAYLEKIILRLLEKHPARRPDSGEVVAGSLQLLGREGARRPGGLVPREAGSLVGHEDHLAELEAWLDHGRTGEVALLSGRRASGHRGVAEALERTARERSWVVLGCACAMGELEPVLTLLWAMGHAFPSPRPAAVTRALKLLDSLDGSHNLSPIHRDEAVAVAARTLAMAWTVSGRGPALAVFHDLHRASPSARAVLDALRSVPSAATDLLLLLVGELPPGQGVDEALRVHVYPLDVREVGLRVGALLHRRPATADLARAVHRATGGLPHLVDEVVAEMVRDGQLRPKGRALERLEWIDPEAEVPVPEALRTRLTALLDGLPRAVRQVLDALAVVEGPVHASDLATMLGADSPDAVLALAGPVLQEGWVRAERDHTGELTLQWCCTLARALSQQRLLPCRRQVHERALLGTCERPTRGRVLLLLRQGRVAESAPLALELARDLRRGQRLRTAAHLLRAVVRALDDTVPAELQVELLLLYAGVQLGVRPSHKSIGRALARARPLATAEQAGAVALTRARLARAIGHLPSHAKLLDEAWEALPEGDPRRLQVAQLHWELARLRGEPADPWAAHLEAHLAAAERPLFRDLYAAATALSAGRLHDSEAASARALAHAREADDLRHASIAASLWAHALRLQGRYSEALAELEALGVIARRGEVPAATVGLQLAEAWCELDLCRLGRAQEHIDELRASVRRGEHLLLRLQLDLASGRVLVASGLHQTAAETLTPVLDRAGAAGLRPLAERARASLAEAQWHLGQYRASRLAFTSAIQSLERAGDVPSLVEVCSARARVLAAREDPEQIFAPIARFLTDHPAYPARLERILARARYLLAQGRPAQGAWTAARQQLGLIGRQLSDTDAAALRLHPWSQALRLGAS